MSMSQYVDAWEALLCTALHCTALYFSAESNSFIQSLEIINNKTLTSLNIEIRDR